MFVNPNFWLRGLLQPKSFAMIEAVMIGLVAALASVMLKETVGWFGGWRIAAAHHWSPWLVLPLIGIVGGGMAGWLIQKFAPEAAGSGIPQVKSALAEMNTDLSLRVAIVKLLSTTLTLGSGFALGRQGPTVQVGAALAGQLSRWFPTSPEYQRQMVAAGAAAGLAAGFNAPLAGVLFVIEELLQDVSSVTLTTSILAAFVGGVVSRILGGYGLDLGKDLLNYKVKVSAIELPFLILLGILVGIFAALFIYGVVGSVRVCRQRLKFPMMVRLALAGGCTGLALAGLPEYFRDSAGLAGLLSVGESTWQLALGAFAARFILTLVACGVEAPGGLFIPSLILGASLGSLMGLLAQSFTGAGEVSTYALAGMGAFFGAVAKVPITAIVIVFELTTNFSLVLPLMICCVTAYLVADRLAPKSLYSRLLKLKGIDLKEVQPSNALWTRLTAADVMQTPVESLSDSLTLGETRQFFATSHHRGFPVLGFGDHVVGIITETDLERARERNSSPDCLITEFMTPQPVTVAPSDTLGRVLFFMSNYKLSRLLVMEHRKLVGIITRSDVLRAEAKTLQPQPQYGRTNSYRVYQRRGPAIGTGRLLLLLDHPKTASHLLRIAYGIAANQNLEIECLNIIQVPQHQAPAEVNVDLQNSFDLFDGLSDTITDLQNQANLAQKRVAIHYQVRVAHDIPATVLETLHKFPTKILIMNYETEGAKNLSNTGAKEWQMNFTAENFTTEVGCDVLLVRLGTNPQWQRWHLPIAGGPNARHSLRFVGALVDALGNHQAFASESSYRVPKITLLQVFPSQKDVVPNPRRLVSYGESLARHATAEVETVALCAKSISEGIIDLALNQPCDVIILGASRKGILQQPLTENIPAEIMRQCECTVIIVQKATARNN